MKKLDPDPNLKSLYYYIRDKENKPLVTVCLMVENKKIVSRGVAICSKKDIPCKVKGKGIAYGRAMKAYNNKKFDGYIDRWEAADVLWSVDPLMSTVFDCKSEYNPTLTPREIKIQDKFK